MRQARRQSRVEEVPVSISSKKSTKKRPFKTVINNKKRTIKKERKKLNLSQTRVKPKSNISQKPKSNISQTQVKHKSNISHSRKNKNKPKSQPKSRLKSNLSQTQVKPESNLSYSSIVGCQKDIIDIIFFEACAIGQTISPPLTIQYIEKVSGVRDITIRKAIQRLENKGHLERTKYKAGRGGWSQYKISEKSYAQMIQIQTKVKHKSNISQIQVKHKSQPESTCSSSSSDLNITTTTTTTNENQTDKNGYLDAVKIPEEIKKIGFRETQVEQISKIGKLSVEELETSLEHFSFDLGEGHIRAKTNPLNMLMGILRHGVYTSSEYLKEEETALENELRGLRERKKRRDDLLKEKQELLFEEWLEPKSKDEIVAIVPTPMNSNEFYMQGIHKELLFNHFVENEMELFKGFQQ